mgnify:CR=1 FL=1
MVILLMGVSGVGKTTVGEALAQSLQWRFVDADDFHSPENRAKMHAGIPLTDADRRPWLEALHNAIAGWLAAAENIVLACSALKASYRELLLVSDQVKLVYLHATFALIAGRLAARAGHYMNPALLKSQFDTLEEPAAALAVDVSGPVEQTVRKIREGVGL